MFGLLDWLKIAGGAGIGFVACLTINAFVWLPAARDEARQQERAAALQKSMELIEERGKTNAEIRNLDDAGLCAALGGLYVNGACQ
ncbi:hypothetical protein [Neorhizobium petrolearium]|uniref:Uncharacterized protein n=1 Tax=Neorhizobium petrolearium TaxID=515361 RepID=A0ABY8M2J3_9HYPH|nr:hypothetical protein [Neorhizobium petrolearium]MCC2608406.1 hypothetical protein [Neorhizobium petrolearium]WGI68684.1 hypothetical protein QEO92_00860 [Neorhizobium petrolearium]